MDNNLFEKLTLLGESAKYDVSCSSSGADRTGFGRIGNTACAGICHSWTADGRCMSLLKVLQSNDCVYDCKYCVNRRTNDISRATFEPEELAEITMEFYRRNYIEGLFLSSAVVRNPDYTAELMLRSLYLLREVMEFGGYIHTKIIPSVDSSLLNQIGFLSDRLSVNVELPSRESLDSLAPQKSADDIFGHMKQITVTQIEQKTLRSAGHMDWLGEGAKKFSGMSIREKMIAEGSMASTNTASSALDRRRKYKERFAPAGQTTQMIVGASPESDRHIIRTSEAMYRKFSVKRVYFSAYIPVNNDPSLPPLYISPPLKREHRLYQADWLLRFYGFTADEILPEDDPNLDVDLDPKIIWALKHIELFPIEVNKASLEELLRIPGIGEVSAKRIVRQRLVRAVRYEDLKKMGVVLKRARFFLTCIGKYYGEKELEPIYIRDHVKQLEREAARRLYGSNNMELKATEMQSISSHQPLLEAKKIRNELSGKGEGTQLSMFDLPV